MNLKDHEPDYLNYFRQQAELTARQQRKPPPIILYKRRKLTTKALCGIEADNSKDR